MEYILYFFFALSVGFPILHSIHCLPFFQKKPANEMTNKGVENGISILIPCYNEEGIIETSVESMKSLSYSQTEVVYINDGSSDRTLILLNKLLKLTPEYKDMLETLDYQEVKMLYRSELYPHILVVDKVNGGKADALNAGIEYSGKPIVITLDADTVLDDSSLLAVNKVFRDDDVVAAGGMVHVLQTKTPHEELSLKKTNTLVRAQALDFLKAFYVNKIALSRFQALAVISGAFGIFTREVLLDVGGYRTTIGEDIDITLKVHQYISKLKGKKIVLIPEAVCYTELPENYRDLFKQRVRWQKAFVDCLIYFSSYLFRSFFTKPVSFFYILEGFLSGTLAVYIMTGALVYNLLDGEVFSLTFILIYTLYIFILGFIYNMVAVGMSDRYGYNFEEKDTLRLVGVIFYDIFVYRFITIFAVIYGTIEYFFNKKSWNKVKRTGRDYKLNSENAA